MSERSLLQCYNLIIFSVRNQIQNKRPHTENQSGSGLKFSDKMVIKVRWGQEYERFLFSRVEELRLF